MCWEEEGHVWHCYLENVSHFKNKTDPHSYLQGSVPKKFPQVEECENLDETNTKTDILANNKTGKYLGKEEKTCKTNKCIKYT